MTESPHPKTKLTESLFDEPGVTLSAFEEDEPGQGLATVAAQPPLPVVSTVARTRVDKSSAIDLSKVAVWPGYLLTLLAVAPVVMKSTGALEIFLLQMLPVGYWCWYNLRLHRFIRDINKSHPHSGNKAALMSFLASPFSGGVCTCLLLLLFIGLGSWSQQGFWGVLCIPFVGLSILGSCVLCFSWYLQSFRSISRFIDRNSSCPGSHGTFFNAIMVGIPFTICSIWGILTVTTFQIISNIPGPRCDLYTTMLHAYAVIMLASYFAAFWALDDLKKALVRVLNGEQL